MVGARAPESNVGRWLSAVLRSDENARDLLAKRLGSRPFSEDPDEAFVVESMAALLLPQYLGEWTSERTAALLDHIQKWVASVDSTDRLALECVIDIALGRKDRDIVSTVPGRAWRMRLLLLFSAARDLNLGHTEIDCLVVQAEHRAKELGYHPPPV
jgi:hypothetical protein